MGETVNKNTILKKKLSNRRRTSFSIQVIMAKSRRAKAVEAPKKPAKKNVQKSAPAKKVAEKVAKSKDEKVPIKKAASKEPPKKVVASKNEVKKPETSKEKPTSAGAATKSLASPLDTPRASGRARKVLGYNAMAKGLDSAEKKPAEKSQGTKRKASISNQDATPAKKKVAVETPKKKQISAKKPAQEEPKKTPAKVLAKAPAKATPAKATPAKATPAPL